MSTNEADIVTYALINRFIDGDIAEDFARLTFTDQVSRENADMTLNSCDSQFFLHLFSKSIPQTQNQSIIFQINKFQRDPPERSGRKNGHIYSQIQRFFLDYRIFGHTRAISDFIFDKTGIFMVTGSEDAQVKIWHMPSISLVFTLKGHGEAVTSLDISPDRKLIASISTDQSLRLWDFNTGAALTMIDFQELGPLSCIKFSPCGRYLACGSEAGNIRIFKLQEIIPKLGALRRQISKFNMDDSITYFNEYDPMMFLAAPPRIIKHLDYNDQINSVSFSPGGNLVAYSFESGRVVITSPEINKTWKIIAHTTPCDGAFFLKNNFHNFVTWSNKGGEAKIWNFQAKPKIVQTFSVKINQSRSHLLDLSVSCDESIFYGVTAQMVFAWTTESTTPLLHCEGYTQLSCVCAHPNLPSVFFVVTKARILIFDAFKGVTPIRQLDIPFETPRINKAKWSVDGLSIIALDAGGGYYRFRSAESATCRQIPTFFPSDFKASEWDEKRGQIEEETKMPTHLTPRNTIIDSDQVVKCESYKPFDPSEAPTPIWPPQLTAAWQSESIWLTNICSKDSQSEIDVVPPPAVSPKKKYIPHTIQKEEPNDSGSSNDSSDGDAEIPDDDDDDDADPNAFA